MNGDLRNWMKVGIVQFMAYPATMGGEGPVLETISSIVGDDFFGAIEITSIKDDAVREQVADLLASSGIVVGYGAQPIQLSNKLDVNSVDEEQRQAAVARLKQAIDEAYALGAGKFALLSGPYPGPDKHAQAMQQLIKSLNELCAYASSKGSMPVVLEVFDREVDKKSLIGPTVEGVEVSAAVRREHPSFGLMLDLSHLPLQFETTQHALTTAKDHITHIHIGNCVVKDKSHPLYGDLHPRFGLPGGENGVPELVEFLRVLREIGYIGEGKQNVVGFEVRPHGKDTSLGVIANAKRTLLEAWAKLT